MKRNILSLLLFVLTSILIVSCSYSGDDSGSAVPVVTPIDLNNPDTLVGTYDITFFYTDAVVVGITNDCDLLSTNFPHLRQCSNPSND